MSDKIIPLNCVTYLDLPPDRIADRIKEQDLEGVVVLGFQKNGDAYFSSSYADGGTVIWLLELCKRRLLDITEARDE